MAQEELRTGRVYRDTEWVGSVGWTVNGNRSVEIVGLKTSCGCVEPRIMAEGKPLQPGLYSPGASGTLEARVRAKPGKESFDESVPLVWRFEGEQDLRFAILRIRGEIADAYRVEPDKIHFAALEPDARPSFTVRWLAGSEVQGDAEVRFEGEGARIGSLNETVNDSGEREFVLSGVVERPADGRYSVFGRLQLIGLDPPAPDLPVEISFEPQVEVSPQSVVELKPQPDGSFAAEVTLRRTNAATTGAASLLPVRVEFEPEQLSRHFAAAIRLASPDEANLLLSYRETEEQPGRTGRFNIHHGIPTDPPVRLLWYRIDPALSAVAEPNNPERKER